MILLTYYYTHIYKEVVNMSDKLLNKYNPPIKFKRILEILKVSTLLGFTSFGGPIAHLGYFHLEYVQKRKWLDEQQYADLVALCQFLPGPASSQIGIGIGTMRAGVLGGIAAWFGFTMPSACMLLLFALLMRDSNFSNAGWIHGLKIVAVCVVAHSIIMMGKKLASEKKTAIIAAFSTAVALLWQTAFTQVAILLIAGFVGILLFRNRQEVIPQKAEIQHPQHKSYLFLIVFVVLLISLPILANGSSNVFLSIFDGFFRSGSLVFGGGHVVLPMLEQEVVPTNLISKADFLAGYGAAQAVPGPLFTFASYLGTLIAGVPGAIVAIFAIFLPSFLLVLGVIPYWNQLRKNDVVKAGLIGVNAAVVGILLAALYNPLWTTAILTYKDFILALALFVLLVLWKAPPLVIVFAGAMGGWLLSIL
ncbi:MAG: chromate efflux transporter [Vallitaleaceae bacterium]|nr:chromate efflux transporter [Vallitaleaceae bacterium]